MPEIGHLTRSKPTQVQIDLGDGDYVSLTFDRAKVKPSMIEEIERPDDPRSLASGLADVIMSWDVTENEQQLPVDTPTIARFSYDAQRALFKRILEESAPSSEEGNASSEQSSTPPTASTPPPQTHQNGPATSPSPEPSTSPSPT